MLGTMLFDSTAADKWWILLVIVVAVVLMTRVRKSTFPHRNRSKKYVPQDGVHDITVAHDERLDRGDYCLADLELHELNMRVPKGRNRKEDK